MNAYLALGSNLGDRAAHLAFGRDQLVDHGIHIEASSAIEETDPVGGPPQPRYLNQVVRVETDYSPRELLSILQRIEAAAGRQPNRERWGPRELDIDILLYGHMTIDTPDLTIPHPQLVNREYVLRELHQVNPKLTDNVSGVTAEQLERELEESGEGYSSTGA
jgi:2-amino-4-hydroxy-6-hydroxymethyldihydropteridine diphosphokinase